jgi:hypothetical protein
MANTWIRQLIQLLGLKNHQGKQVAAPQKSSTKLVPRVTHGFENANSLCWLRNHQRNCFLRVTLGFYISNSPCGLRNHQLKLSRCRVRNHQRNCFHGWHMEITVQTASIDSKSSTKTESMPTQKSSTKLLPHVTNGFDITNSPYGLRNHQLKLTRCRCRNHQWNCFQADTWIRQRTQSLPTQKSLTKTESLPPHKSSTKLVSRVTRRFDSANSSCSLRNHQQKLDIQAKFCSFDSLNMDRDSSMDVSMIKDPWFASYVPFLWLLFVFR